MHSSVGEIMLMTAPKTYHENTRSSTMVSGRNAQRALTQGRMMRRAVYSYQGVHTYHRKRPFRKVLHALALRWSSVRFLWFTKGRGVNRIPRLRTKNKTQRIRITSLHVHLLVHDLDEKELVITHRTLEECAASTPCLNAFLALMLYLTHGRNV